jgi:hypothetical protein
MRPMIALALLMVSVPVAVFFAGAQLMAGLSGRHRVTARLEQHAAIEDRQPLNQRRRYDQSAVERHWGALDAETLAAERTFLELDLVFPLLYGAAFAVSLLLGLKAAAPSLNPAWPIGLVAVTVLSDWTENLVQLSQLRRYAAGGVAALDARWIAVASAATAIKLLFFVIATLAVLALAGLVLARPAR